MRDVTGRPAVLPADALAVLATVPMPRSPAEAWKSLSAGKRASIGELAITMVLTEILSGRAYHPDDRILDERGQWDAGEVADRLSELLRERVEALLPDLFGPEGEHPAWVAGVEKRRAGDGRTV